MFIEAHGKTYTFYDHAVERMRVRKIPLDWVETALREPDDIVELTPNRKAFDKVIEENHSIRVVVDEESSEIVTIYPVEED